jgi:glucose/mannose transport system permease protein
MSTATTPAAPIPAPMHLRRRRATRTTARVLKLAAIVFFAVLVLTPLYVAVVTSFKEAAETDPAHAWSLPSVWTLDAWREAWNVLSPNLTNTFKLVIPATIISTILGSLNGFVLSKWRFPGADVVFTLFLFGLFIPYQAVMIPLTTLLSDIHFPDQIPSLAFAHIVYGIPITTLIFRSYYATIPEELMEAARMDRAGMLRTYWSVVLPLSAPAFVVTAIWQFTQIWNDFLLGVVVLSNPTLSPVTVAVNNVAGSFFVEWNMQMAAALLAAAPTVIVYLFLGRLFMRGLLAGSLKG